MSQSRQIQIPAHSSSPSKSSFRRPSATSQHLPSARGLLPSPHFDEDPIVAFHESPRRLGLSGSSSHEHAIASEHSGPERDDAAADAIPSFQPFFTLLEDGVTNEHYHPTVHYIFADDDAEIIAEAACRSLEALDPSQREPRSRKDHDGRPAADDDPGDQAPRLPPRIAGVREHYLVLDVESRSAGDDLPPSYEVTSAQSLSAEWQVLRSTISAAPTIGDGGAGEEEALMLRIEGRGHSAAEGLDKDKDRDKETVEEMIDRFQRRLEDIRQVMDANTTGSGVGALAGGAGSE